MKLVDKENAVEDSLVRTLASPGQALVGLELNFENVLVGGQGDWELLAGVNPFVLRSRSIIVSESASDFDFLEFLKARNLADQ